MKESIGATYILAICMTLIVLFTGYLAISVNYSKAFRIKSEIVSQIENNKKYDGGVEEKVKSYLTAQGYTAYGECPSTIVVKDEDFKDTESGWKLKTCIQNSVPKNSDKCNACIYHLDVGSDLDNICEKRSYYKVITFFKFDIPIVNTLLTFKVSGDTGNVGISCDN